MSTLLHHAGLQHYDLPDLTISGDTLISLGLVALMVTLLCGVAVVKSTRRSVL